MTDEEFVDDTGQYEVVEEHRAGSHRGGWYEYCPLCDVMGDEDAISVHCSSGYCHTEQLVRVSVFRADPEFSFVCIGCQTGVNMLAECADCHAVLAREDQHRRVHVHNTDLVRIVDHETVCLSCLMSDPGDPDPWEM